MADYGPFIVGGDAQPLSTTSVNSLLRDSDPALFFCLDYFAFLITTYQGPRLLQAVAICGPSTIKAAVAQKYPLLPQPEFLENQFAFPLLCIGRTRTETRRKTIGWDDDRGLFDLLYVLPPLNPGQTEQLLPIRKAIYEGLRHKATQGFDPGYTPPGGTLGQSPWGLAFGAVESIGFGHDLNEAESATYGFLEGTGNLLFPCLRMTGYIIERDMYVPGQKFAGGDIEVDLLATDGSLFPNLINLATQQAPTVTSISPTTGTNAGGTAVTITGTLFLPGPRVLFGPYPATNVVWVNATTITCNSPSLSGGGVVSVTVQNRDGQAGSLQNAFTYTVPTVVLVSIAVTPTNPSIGLVATDQFTATGTYSDSSTLNITTSCTWTSSLTGVATISNISPNIGLATAVAAGTTVITATDPATSIFGNTNLTVAAAFDPSSLSGLIVWLRADVGITLQAGVSRWADQSGHGNDVVQATNSTSKQPAYHASGGANNQAYIQFTDNSAQILQAGSFSQATPYEYLLVLDANGTANANNYVFDLGTNNGYTSVANAGANWIVATTSGATFLGVTTGTPHLVDAQMGSGTGSAVLDNTTTAGSGGGPAAGGLTVGSYGANIGSNAFGGKVYEVIVYNRALSSGERGQLHTYSQTRYGSP
jgi:hypothetical protein